MLNAMLECKCYFSCIQKTNWLLKSKKISYKLGVNNHSPLIDFVYLLCYK